MSSELRAKITNVLFEFVTRLTPDEAADRIMAAINTPPPATAKLPEGVEVVKCIIAGYDVWTKDHTRFLFSNGKEWRYAEFFDIAGGMFKTESDALTAAQQQGEAEPNRPLEVSIASGRLIISIGVDTLASAAERCLRFYDGERDRYTLTVADKEKFATEVVRALQHEEEDGTTPLHVLLDDAFEAAVDDGCEGVALAACPPKTESEA